MRITHAPPLVVVDGVVDFGVVEAHGEVVAPVSSGDHRPTTQHLEGNVVEPRRVGTICGAGVDRQDEWVTIASNHLEQARPPGWILGQEERHLSSVHHLVAIPARHALHLDERRNGLFGRSAEDRGGSEGEGGVAPVERSRQGEGVSVQNPIEGNLQVTVICATRHRWHRTTKRTVTTRPAIVTEGDVTTATRTANGVEVPR